MKQFIYADNAATTRLDSDAYEAMKTFFQKEYANVSQPYSFAKMSKRALKDARKTIAECINASPEEIFFTSGGTESDNWAIKGFGLPKDIKRIITTEIEHHAILNACDDMEKFGLASVKYLPVDNYGVISGEDLENALYNGDPVASCETTLVSVMLSNNEIGTIQDIKQLAHITHRHGSIFHTDAVQSVGHIPIDVRELGIDMMSASAHKFNGPKGIGFLYVKKGTLLSSLISGGKQELGLRAGTENVAAIIGMAVALKNNTYSLNTNIEHIRMLENILIQKLDAAGIRYRRNGINHVPGNLSLSFPGYDGEMLLHRLDLMGICVSTGAACDSVKTQISHVLRAINLDKTYAIGTIRVSLGRDNTEEDVLKIAESLGEIIKVSKEG